MRESHHLLQSRRLGALALAGLLAATLAAMTPSGITRAAPEVPQGAIIGPARVIDGDTIEIGAKRIRLEGIDAPEAGQECSRPPEGKWSCGETATRELAALVAGKDVRCDSRGLDRYGRTLAVCWVGSVEINAEMVRNGLAWAFVRYSQRLAGVEADARRRGVGIWQAATEPAWSFRTSRWLSAGETTPRGCAIKGEVLGASRRYYVPWDPAYSSIRIDRARGSRWFCSEAEALAAGWQPAHPR